MNKFIPPVTLDSHTPPPFNEGVKFEKLGEDIYVVKNAIPEEICDQVKEFLDTADEKIWDAGGIYFKGRSSIPMEKETKHIHEIARNIFSKDYMMIPVVGFMRMFKDQFHSPHTDNQDYKKIREAAKYINTDEPVVEKDDSRWGFIIYYNDFEGGSLFYPDQCRIYHPKKGDILIHSSEEHCIHGVSRLESETRYTSVGMLYVKIKIPKRLDNSL